MSHSSAEEHAALPPRATPVRRQGSVKYGAFLAMFLPAAARKRSAAEAKNGSPPVRKGF